MSNPLSLGARFKENMDQGRCDEAFENLVEFLDQLELTRLDRIVVHTEGRDV